MKDITEYLLAAVNKDVLWSVSCFYEIVEQFTENNYTVSYWEGEENWAVIISEGIIVGYLWYKYPMLFVLKTYKDGISLFLNQYEYLTIVETEDFIKAEFRLDYIALQERLEYGANYNSFSVVDLWYFNNSR